MRRLRQDSSPGQAFFLWSGHYLATAHSDPWEKDGKIRFWRVKDGTLVRTISAHAGRVERILFTRDSRFLISAGGYDIRVWGVK